LVDMANEIVRKLASVKEVTSVKPVPGADFIEAVVVDCGWQVVERKGRVSVGELVVFAEPDSFIPFELAPFLSKGKEPREYNGVKGERLRTVKLKKTLSQGLIFKLSDLPEAILRDGLSLGDDLTEALGITKWEAPIPACLAGKVRGNFPSFIPKTDQERVQSIGSKLSDYAGKIYEITEKLEGSSCTVYLKDDTFGVCSRRLDLEETSDNTFWAVARKLNLEEKMREAGLSQIALQGETVGPKIQDNIYKLQDHGFFVFDVFDIEHQRYLAPAERKKLCEQLGIKHTPILGHIDIQAMTVDDIVALADGFSELHSEVLREGIVFKSECGELSFKSISNKYLLKTKL
jgi:RNA ligase (TIGR02306 family)